MTGYLLDTNHASAVWKSDSSLLARISGLRDAELSLCLPSIGELWFMVHNSSRVAENESSLRHFLSAFGQMAFDAPAAERFGAIKAHLRKTGRPIPAVDVQIAAIAIARSQILLTADAHFAAIPGLVHENWL